jgi:hypothetical protein
LRKSGKTLLFADIYGNIVLKSFVKKQKIKKVLGCEKTNLSKSLFPIGGIGGSTGGNPSCSG